MTMVSILVCFRGNRGRKQFIWKETAEREKDKIEAKEDRMRKVMRKKKNRSRECNRKAFVSRTLGSK